MTRQTAQRVVLVTGGGTGIGRATAHVFADHGADVVIAGRRRDVLLAAAAGRPRIQVMVADIANPRGIDDLVAAVRTWYGRLDVLVHNAGVADGGALASVDDDVVDRVVAVNLLAPIRLTRALLPELGAARAVVVTISTAVDRRGWPGASLYAATKAALESLTRSWAVELAPGGIRVVGVAPGAVATEIGKHAGLSAEQVEQRRAWQRDRTPMGRLGTPAEIADAVLFLASPAASFVTGAVLSVDGGAVIA